MIKAIMGAAMFVAIAGSVCAQGSYTLTANNGSEYNVFLGTNALGNPVVYLDEVEQLGWKWVVKDTDGDGKKDDLRITDAGVPPNQGTTDLKNGANDVQSGTAHDGNVAYPANQIGTWAR